MEVGGVSGVLGYRLYFQIYIPPDCCWSVTEWGGVMVTPSPVRSLQLHSAGPVEWYLFED